MIAFACLALFAQTATAQKAGETSIERFVDFEAPVDGEGTIESPWNTLVDKPIEGSQEVILWLQGEANPLQIPIAIKATGPGVETLRILSRHLVDSSVPRAHLTRGFSVDELGYEPIGGGIYRTTLPPMGWTPVAVLRGWAVPAHRPIPPEGLISDLAFNRSYVESFRIMEEPRVALRPAGSLAELQAVDEGWVVNGADVYLKTPSGDAPGSGQEPAYRVAVSLASEQRAFITVNDFDPYPIQEVEVAGLTVSLMLRYGSKRTLEFYPGAAVLIRDMLFVACNDDDNIAVVNGGGPGDIVRAFRNQHIGIGTDGGPLVVSTQGNRPPYERVEIADQVVHAGYELLYLDGSDANLGFPPRFGIGSFHEGKVASADFRRSIALSYNQASFAPFQCPMDPAQIAGIDARDGDAMPVQVADVYVESVREMWNFNARGVAVRRSYFGPSPVRINQLSRSFGLSYWESCLFVVDGRYAVLGGIASEDVAFANSTIRSQGDSRAALFGVASNATGRAFIHDLVVERAGSGAGPRFVNSALGFGPPPLLPGVVVGWDGTPDLGQIWFGPNTLDAGSAGFQTPELGASAGDLPAFREIHGNGVRVEVTGAESLPANPSPADLAAAYASSDLARPLSSANTGPMGLNRAGFSGRLGAFQSGHPDACSVADRAPPYGAITFADLTAFLVAFAAGDPSVDAEEPRGLTFADVTRFLAVYDAGCP